MTVWRGSNVGVITQQVGVLANWTPAAAGKPITPIAEIMPHQSQVYRNIYRISKTLSLAVSLGCLISRKPFLGQAGRAPRERGTREATHQKILSVQKKRWGFLL